MEIAYAMESKEQRARKFLGDFSSGQSIGQRFFSIFVICISSAGAQLVSGAPVVDGLPYC